MQITVSWISMADYLSYRAINIFRADIKIRLSRNESKQLWPTYSLFYHRFFKFILSCQHQHNICTTNHEWVDSSVKRILWTSQGTRLTELYRLGKQRTVAMAKVYFSYRHSLLETHVNVQIDTKSKLSLKFKRKVMRLKFKSIFNFKALIQTSFGWSIQRCMNTPLTRKSRRSERLYRPVAAEN